MSIQNRRQLEQTRQKLTLLEERCRALEAETVSASVSPNRKITIRSLKKLINQMKEEIARFESRASAESQRG
jgi:hypothetical protein